MKVLVAHASRHGATAGIAERIAETLQRHGIAAEPHPVEEVEGIEGYDAVVLGGAAYMFHWLKAAVRFARRHRAELAARPVWLFSSGPLGHERLDADGNDMIETGQPKEFEELVAAIHPRDVQVFFGAYDPAAPAVGLGERFVQHMPAGRDALPAGDFRDWEAIEAWAGQIAEELGRGR